MWPKDRHEKPVRFECRYLIHSTPCFGYRFEVDGKILAFCTDTGVCENAIELCRDADLMITECSFKPGQYSSIWPHLNPEDAVNMARTPTPNAWRSSIRCRPVQDDRGEVRSGRAHEREVQGIFVGEDDKEITV